MLCNQKIANYSLQVGLYAYTAALLALNITKLRDKKVPLKTPYTILIVAINRNSLTTGNSLATA